MAPKAKETPFERAARLQKIATGINNKADRDLCIAVLKKREDIVPQVKSLMVNLGVLQDAATAAPSQGPAYVIQASPNDTTQTAAVPTKVEKLVAPRNMDEVDENHELHRNYSTWGLVPTTYLCWLLSRLEPVTFSIANMKGASGKRNGRLPALECVLQWFEITTGMDADQSVGETRVLKDAAQRLLDASLRLGRRGRDLSLPVDWAAQGIYKLVVSSDRRPFLTNRWTNQSAELEGVEVAADGTVAHTIDMNWSEHRAIVNILGASPTSKLCVSILGLSIAHPLVAVSSGGRKRRGASVASGSTDAEESPVKKQAMFLAIHNEAGQAAGPLALTDGDRPLAISDAADAPAPATPTDTIAAPDGAAAEAEESDPDVFGDHAAGDPPPPPATEGPTGLAEPIPTDTSAEVAPAIAEADFVPPPPVGE